MTAQTEALPDLLESLEFQPICSCGRAPYAELPPCDNAAQWIYHIGCCPRVYLVCDDHHRRWQASRSEGLLVSRCTVCNRTRISFREYILSWTRL